MFTAATIHLLSVAKGNNVTADTMLVERCIAALDSMGQTWKCALQCKLVLQRLLHEWHPKLAKPDGGQGSFLSLEVPDAAKSTPASSEAFRVREMLQQNPAMAEELQRLGWVPPGSNTTVGSISSDGLGMLSVQDTEHTWIDQPNTPATRDQSLFDEMLISNEGMPPEAWADQLFSLGAGPGWSTEWSSCNFNVD